MEKTKMKDCRFTRTFGMPPANVILAMDQAGDDPAQQVPVFSIPIQEVGVDRHHIPIKLRRPGDDVVTTLQCEVQLRTYLPASYRGIHISRLGNVVAVLSLETFESLSDYAESCASQIASQQYEGLTRVTVRGHLASVTNMVGRQEGEEKKSLDTIEVQAAHTWSRKGAMRMVGLCFDHITACPCVQQTMKHTASLAAAHRYPVDQIPLFFTHSQRCQTRVEVHSAMPLPSHDVLMGAIETEIIRTRSTLPREHELLLVHEAHRRPQFLEDVMRGVAASVTQACQALDDDSRIVVSSTSFESIHEYDLQGYLSYPLGELRALLHA